MRTEKGKSGKKRIALIIVIAIAAAAVLAGAITGLVLGLQNKWRNELINDIQGPSEDESFCITMHTIAGQEEQPVDYTFKYNPDRQNFWLYMDSNDTYKVFAKGETCYGFSNFYVTASDGTKHRELVLDEVFELSDFADSRAYSYFQSFSANTPVADIEDAVKTVNKTTFGGINTYNASFDKDLFFRLTQSYEDYEQIKKYIKTEDGPSLTVKTERGTDKVRSAEFSYAMEYSDDLGNTMNLKAELSLDVAYGEASAQIDPPEQLFLYLAIKDGLTEKENAECKEEKAEVMRVSYDGAVRYLSFSEYTPSQVSDWAQIRIFAENDMFAVWYGTELGIYRISTLEKLRSLSYYYEITDVDMENDRMIVAVNGMIDAGNEVINSGSGYKTTLLLYDISDFYLLNTYRPDYIPDLGCLYLYGDSIICVYTDYVYPYARSIKIYNFTDGAQQSFVTGINIFTSSQLDRDNGILYLSNYSETCTFDIKSGALTFGTTGNEDRLYAEPEGFNGCNYAGATCGDYDLVTLNSDMHYCLGFYNRVSGKFDYILPAFDSSVDSAFAFCEVGENIYICTAGTSAFILDMSKAAMHPYSV